MEEGETVTKLSRKELRKQKLMEYLAAKGKLKQPNPRPYLRDDCQNEKPVTSALKNVKEKENKAPTDGSRLERTKIQTLFPQSTKQPARKAFGVTDKANVKGNILTATNGPTKPKPNPKPLLARTYNVVSSKSNLNSASSHLKKKTNTGIQSSSRASSSNATRTVATKSNGRVSSAANATWSRPIKTSSIRMSLGPMVKTKTGLIPAMIQPRDESGENETQTFSTAAHSTTTTASVINKVRSSSSSTVSLSQKFAMTQRKTFPTASLKNPVKEKSRVTLKVQNSKPLPGKLSQPPSCKNQPRALKSTSTSSKCTAAPSSKPTGRLEMSKTNMGEEEGKQQQQQPCKVTSRTSSAPVSRCSSSALSAGVARPAAADLGGKPKTFKGTDTRKTHSSVNAPQAAQPPTGLRRPSSPVMMSRTVPQPSRTVSFTGKTPKVPVRIIPQTEVKKLTAVQEERMRQLQEWRESRGISYKRPPMPVKAAVRRSVAVHQPWWSSMKEEEDAHSLISAVDSSLADCIKLITEGCPSDQVREVLSRLPTVSRKFAKYWICQARLMEQEGNLDVLHMFEEAVGVVLEPVDELRTVVFEILKKRDEIQAQEKNETEEEEIPSAESSPEAVSNPLMTPKPVRAFIYGENGDSSVVKYKITATPGGPPSQQKEPRRVNGQEVRFFTPVRRSVRIERSSLRYPASLQDHDLCVASYDDLISEEKAEGSPEQQGVGTSPPEADNNNTLYVYRENEALQDKVFVKLFCDEDV